MNLALKLLNKYLLIKILFYNDLNVYFTPSLNRLIAFFHYDGILNANVKNVEKRVIIL